MGVGRAMKKMKKGYHYTSKKNWEQIQKDGGMKKYITKKEELDRYFPDGINGIWLWKDNPEGKSHAGNIMFQVGTKSDPDIVKLEVEYNPYDVANYHGSNIDIRHHGKVSNWSYHNNEQAVIVKSDIPLQQIRLIGEYNTVQRLQ